MSEAERQVGHTLHRNSQLQQSRSKKRTMPSQDTPTHQAMPTHQGVRSPGPRKATAKPRSVQPSQKRVRVSSSDGRMCNLCLDVAVTYAQLQEAIEKDLK